MWHGEDKVGAVGGALVIHLVHRVQLARHELADREGVQVKRRSPQKEHRSHIGHRRKSAGHLEVTAEQALVMAQAG